MDNPSILNKIIKNPQMYEVIINKASYDELKVIFEAYKQRYTDENLANILPFYSEAKLRQKLLGCSQTVISTSVSYTHLTLPTILLV